jgi:O-antigen/teichoic acid export membrane protein
MPSKLVLRTIEKIKTRFVAGSFASHAAALLSGTLVAQLIGLASLPILTSIYTVEQFGEYALYLAIAGFGTVIATGRYEMAIMLPRHNKDAISLVVLSVFIAIFLSTISLLVIIIADNVCLHLQLCSAFPRWSYLIPLTILLTGIYQALYYFLSRNKLFASLSQARVAQAIVTAAASILVGYASGAGALGLIFGTIAGQFVGVLLFAWFVKRKCVFASMGVSRRRMGLNAFRYKDFPIINSMNVAIDAIQTSVVPIVIGMLFGKIALGYYTFALRIIGVPVSLVSSTAAQIFFQRASEQFFSGKKIYPLVCKLHKHLTFVVIPIFLTLMVVAPVLFGQLFGADWVPAGEVTRILSPWLAINIFASAISQLPIILGKQGEAFFVAIIGKFTLMASLAIGWACRLDIFATLIILSLLMSIYTIYVIWWSNRLTIMKDSVNVA